MPTHDEYAVIQITTYLLAFFRQSNINVQNELDFYTYLRVGYFRYINTLTIKME